MPRTPTRNGRCARRGSAGEALREIIARLKPDDASVPTSRTATGTRPASSRARSTPSGRHRHSRRAGGDRPGLATNGRRPGAAGRDYYQIGTLEISPSSKWAAFCEDFVGRRQYELRFKHLTTGRILEDAIVNVEIGIAWANDNETVLYVEKDSETLLGLYVKRHRVGQDPQFRSHCVHTSGYQSLTPGSQVQVRPVHFHPHGEHRLLGMALRARGRSGARVHGFSSPRSATTSTRSIIWATVSSSAPTGRRAISA